MNEIFEGFLIDLDGVLYVGNRAVDGAKEAIEFLKENGYPFRCVSNTTRKSRHSVASSPVSHWDFKFRKTIFSLLRLQRLRT